MARHTEGEEPRSLRDYDEEFEPLGLKPRRPRPEVHIDPDPSKGWWRRILPLVKAHRWLLATSLVTSLIALMANVAAPAVVQAAIDRALLPPRSSPLTPFVVTLALLAAARAVFAFAYRYGLYRLAYELETDLRSIVYRHLTRMSFSFFDRAQTGQLVSRANSDIRAIQMFLAFGPFMFTTTLMFLVAFGYMLSVHAPLAILAVLPLPGVYLVGHRLRDRMFPLSWIVQGRLAEVATVVDENINGVRVVKSFAAEERQIRALARAATRLRWAAVRQIDERARHAPLMENLPRLGMVIVLGYGGWLTMRGDIQVGTIVAFNAYIAMLQAPFRLLGFFLMMGQRAKASAERIYEILDQQPEIRDRPGALVLRHPEGALQMKSVEFGYRPGSPILTGLDMEIEPGEKVALVGRTGCGKSTLARLIPRFYDVWSGSVLFDGTDVRDITQTSLRAAVCMVGDEPFLFSATVRDNIAFPRPDAPMEEIVEAARIAGAHEFISELPHGYDTVVGERGYTLSGGQRQRVALARAILARPKLLVLDDATSAVDVRIEEQILAALAERLESCTTLVISHRISTVSLADRVLLLDDGRIVAEGSHSHLLRAEPTYREILVRPEGSEGTGAAAARRGEILVRPELPGREVAI
ncbi:MAG: hypothetical protein KatS3mg008_0439 [Acidimicrobiales bacterium]|nr:MAG: hypothetical protein KatS3mg008_0439 [Acidimicrobiales bacterium]